MDCVNPELIQKIVQLGTAIRRQQSEGNLRSVPPPGIYGYLSCLRLIDGLPFLSLQQAAGATLMGNASNEDKKKSASVFNEVFGLRKTQDEDDLTMDLF